MSQRPHPDNPIGDASTPPPPFALAELSERCMGNAAVATLVLDKFEKQLTADIREIQERLAAQDTGQIARTAHALKGAAGAVAAQALRELAAKVEILARQDQLDSIAQEMSSLRSEVERCLDHLPTARRALASAASGESGGTEAAR